MSIFQQVANAQVQGRGTKIAESGRFLVEITSVHMQPSNQGFGLMFIVEFDVIEGTAAHPRGARRSWVQRPETRKNTDLGNIKAFVAAMHDLDPDADLDPALGEALVDDANPGAGRQLLLETEAITTKGGYPFTLHKWSPVNTSFAADSTAVPAAPEPPAAPDIHAERERWLAGEGPGTKHPTSPGYEYNPQHRDWPCRRVGK